MGHTETGIVPNSLECALNPPLSNSFPLCPGPKVLSPAQTDTLHYFYTRGKGMRVPAPGTCYLGNRWLSLFGLLDPAWLGSSDNSLRASMEGHGSCLPKRWSDYESTGVSNSDGVWCLLGSAARPHPLQKAPLGNYERNQEESLSLSPALPAGPMEQRSPLVCWGQRGWPSPGVSVS